MEIWLNEYFNIKMPRITSTPWRLFMQSMLECQSFLDGFGGTTLLVITLHLEKKNVGVILICNQLS